MFSVCVQWPADPLRPLQKAANGGGRTLGLAALLLVTLLAHAWAGSPPTSPFLRLAPLGHIGAIPSISVDAAGTLMATASYDKTIRLWSLPDGLEREVLRPPIGPGREGEIWSVALTPDGQRVFAAGDTGRAWDGTFSIYLFSVAAAHMIGRLPGLPSPVMALAVSPDGTRLAAGLAVGGIRVWNAHSGRALFADADYHGLVRSLVFDRQNRVYTTASDGEVRAYSEAGVRVSAVTPRPGEEPWGLAASPDGGLLAVTFANPDQAHHLHLDVLRTSNLTRAYAPDAMGLAGEGLLAVAWARDADGGVQLLAGGYARRGAATIIRVWNDYGLGSFRDLAAARDTVFTMAAVPGGGAVYGAADPGWGFIAPNGSLAFLPEPPMADLRPARRELLGISDNGERVLFAFAPRRESGPGGLSAPRLPRLAFFDAAHGRLCILPPTSLKPTANRGIQTGCAPAPATLGALARAKLTAPGISVAGWQDTDGPRLNGRPLVLAHEEFSRAVAVLPNRRGVLLATDSHLRLYAPDGRLLAAAPLPAPAWAVTVNAESTIAVAALLDGTLRWYGLGGGTRITPRAALFVAADTKRWVLFTPAGLFEASGQGGDRLVGVEFDRKADQAPLWVSFSEVFRLLYDPAAVRAALAGDRAPEVARLARLGSIRTKLLDLPEARLVAACLPEASGACPALPFQPTATIDIPADAARLRLTLSLSDRSVPPGPIDLFVNGRNVGRIGNASAAAASTENLLVPLDPGPNQVALRIYNRSATVFSTTPTLDLARAGTPARQEPGTLYILAIGIDHFAAPSLTLRYAVPDAGTFASLMQRAAAPIYPRIVTTQLTDAEATRSGIMAALARLAQEVRPHDTFLLYVATHGVVDPLDGRFLLAPADLGDLSNWQSIEQGAIDENTLIQALAAIRARDALLFVDTCYSGSVTADALANVSHEVGRYLISASSSVQEALDSYDNHNGLMIYALRQGLDGAAPHGPQGVIGALSLGEYLSERIAALARERGHAQDAEFKAAQRDLISFPVAEVLIPPAAAAGP